jgi:hypothetical protein
VPHALQTRATVVTGISEAVAETLRDLRTGLQAVMKVPSVSVGWNGREMGSGMSEQDNLYCVPDWTRNSSLHTLAGDY